MCWVMTLTAFDRPASRANTMVTDATIRSGRHAGHARPATRRERSDAGGVHAAQLVLQVADLVAEAGRDLELKLSGGRVHLLGELSDQPDQLAAGRAAGRPALGGRGGLDGRTGPAGQAG